MDEQKMLFGEPWLGWVKKFKGDRERGGAWIHVHPDALEGRGVVENHHGFSFNGHRFSTLEEAKAAALAHTLNTTGSP